MTKQEIEAKIQKNTERIFKLQAENIKLREKLLKM